MSTQFEENASARDVLSPHRWRLPQLPLDVADLLRRRRYFKRELLKQPSLLSTRIAILGGSTTSEIKSMLEIFLLAHGIQPTFYESGYNRFSEDLTFHDPDLWTFKPEIVFIHTNWRNVSGFPELLDSDIAVESRVRLEMGRFEFLWQKIHDELGALVVQNNFDLPDLRPLGNLEASEVFGRTNFLLRLNNEFARYARTHTRFLINDIHYLSAQLGLAKWHGASYWYNFHLAISPSGCVALAHNAAKIIKSIYGKSRKCLVLDLDNTIWGGVIGDDGLTNLILGRDHPAGEAFLDFQKYVKDLRQRGIILAVCSKNDPDNGKMGFSHPDSILKLEDFSAFKANWKNKPENIRQIAAELNLGLDSIVFVDDNPAERALVAAELPEVAVPEVGSDVSLFSQILEREGYFELHKLVAEDLNRAAHYSSNASRETYRSNFADYGEFLASLQMTAEIAPFCSIYLDRITQLVNKTNQFNLTTRRYTNAELEAIATDPSFATLYGKLTDKFGDNGLVSALIGSIAGGELHIDLWVMSCRVLKREMELAMFDALVEQCQTRDIHTIRGTYIPSTKNAIVRDHYSNLGFTRLSESGGRELWRFTVPGNYINKSRYVNRANELALSACGAKNGTFQSRGPFYDKYSG